MTVEAPEYHLDMDIRRQEDILEMHTQIPTHTISATIPRIRLSKRRLSVETRPQDVLFNGTITRYSIARKV